MQKKSIYFLLAFFGSLILYCEANAQEALKPRPSPFATVTMKYENTYVKVTYNRPHRRDREIFGKLVPFGKVWRTGANEATEITSTGEITIGGKKLDPGTYTVFSIPDADHWTIILNSELGQWGSRGYNEKFDIARFNVPVEYIKTTHEPFTIEFEQNNSETNLVMIWENTKVSLPIEF